MRFAINLHLKDLSYVLLPCSGQVPEEYKANYNLAYNLWRAVWSKELKKLDGIPHLYSNDFTRHDFFSCIFHFDVPVSLYCFSIVDLNYETVKNDSWFAPWPRKVLNELSSKGQRCLMPSWLTVNPMYRRTSSNSPINFSLVQTELGVRKTYELNVQMTFGTARIERGVNKTCRSLGGQSKGTSKYRDGAVELFTFSFEDIKNKYKTFSLTQNYLWKHRCDPTGVINQLNEANNEFRKAI